MFFYVSVFVWITVAPAYFTGSKWHLSKKDAAKLLFWPYTISAIISPLLGFSIDKIGYSVSWVLLATFGLSLLHYLCALSIINPTIVVIWLGIVYSVCAASLWPMLAIVVDMKFLGTGYGLMTGIFLFQKLLH